jgi:hypothetical protein
MQYYEAFYRSALCCPPVAHQCLSGALQEYKRPASVKKARSRMETGKSGSEGAFLRRFPRLPDLNIRTLVACLSAIPLGPA